MVLEQLICTVLVVTFSSFPGDHASNPNTVSVGSTANEDGPGLFTRIKNRLTSGHDKPEPKPVPGRLPPPRRTFSTANPPSNRGKSESSDTLLHKPTPGSSKLERGELKKAEVSAAPSRDSQPKLFDRINSMISGEGRESSVAQNHEIPASYPAVSRTLVLSETKEKPNLLPAAKPAKGTQSGGDATRITSKDSLSIPAARRTEALPADSSSPAKLPAAPEATRMAALDRSEENTNLELAMPARSSHVRIETEPSIPEHWSGFQPSLSENSLKSSIEPTKDESERHAGPVLIRSDASKGGESSGRMPVKGREGNESEQDPIACAEYMESTRSVDSPAEDLGVSRESVRLSSPQAGRKNIAVLVGSMVCGQLGQLPLECYLFGLLLSLSGVMLMRSRSSKNGPVAMARPVQPFASPSPHMAVWPVGCGVSPHISAGSDRLVTPSSGRSIGAILLAIGLAIVGLGVAAVARAHLASQPSLFRSGVIIAAVGQIVLLAGLIALASSSARESKSRKAVELALLQAEVSRMQFAMASASQASVFGMGNPWPATSAPVTYPNHAGQIAQIKAQLACLAQQLDQLAPGEQGRVPTGV